MLKNVVLPAPLGPMIETMPPSRDGEGDVVDGDEAAEDLRQALGLEQRVAVGSRASLTP